VSENALVLGFGFCDQEPQIVPRQPDEDPRLTHLTKIALALPEARRQIYGSHAQFLVRKKTFAYFLDNHHGDGIVAVTCKVLPGDNKALADAQPRRFYLPAYIASRGWVALRLDVGKIDWDEVRELLLGSYALIAPKRLAELVKGDNNT
jgi:phosphoribosylglycinamide formyltransferase-1